MSAALAVSRAGRTLATITSSIAVLRLGEGAVLTVVVGNRPFEREAHTC